MLVGDTFVYNNYLSFSFKRVPNGKPKLNTFAFHLVDWSHPLCETFFFLNKMSVRYGTVGRRRRRNYNLVVGLLAISVFFSAEFAVVGSNEHRKRSAKATCGCGLFVTVLYCAINVVL